MARHNDIGRWGEDIAADYLVAGGYAIVGRNLRFGRDEIDIVATRGSGIMFVEVKTRSTPFDDPLDAVNPEKRRRMARFADSFLRSGDYPQRPQFDIITTSAPLPTMSSPTTPTPSSPPCSDNPFRHLLL